MQVSCFSNASDIVNIARRSILPRTEVFITRSLNSATRIAGASRSSDAIDRTPADRSCGIRCEWKIEPALCPTAWTVMAPGFAFTNSPSLVAKYHAPPFCGSLASAAVVFIAPQVAMDPGTPRTTTSIALSFASSSHPRARPGRLSFTASHRESASPVSHTKCTGKAPLSRHQSIWSCATPRPASLSTRPPCAQMTSGTGAVLPARKAGRCVWKIASTSAFVVLKSSTLVGSVEAPSASRPSGMSTT